MKKVPRRTIVWYSVVALARPSASHVPTHHLSNQKILLAKAETGSKPTANRFITNGQDDLSEPIHQQTSLSAQIANV